MKSEMKARLTISANTLNELARFIGTRQWATIRELMDGEEGQFFIDKMNDIASTLVNMPKTFETNGQGDNAIAQLHYFTAGGDWWVIEKDTEPEQHQAFCFGCLNEDWPYAEWGYVSLPKILDAGAELDLYWTPVSLTEVAASRVVNYGA